MGWWIFGHPKSVPKPPPPVVPEDEPIIGDFLKLGEILGGEAPVSDVEHE